MGPAQRHAWRLRLGGLALLVVGLLAWVWAAMLAMPGERWKGPLPPLSPRERALAEELRRDVVTLAGDIGERNLHTRPDELLRTAEFVEAELAGAGLDPGRHCWDRRRPNLCNVEAEVRGASRRGEIVVVGAHYDTTETPGADDNASGVAAMLALARDLARDPAPRTLRFVAFTNEEAPYFQSPEMGSLAYARRCKERNERVVAMLSIESIGYYTEEPNSQSVPPPLGPLFPSVGDFIALVSDIGSRDVLRRAISAFRRGTRFPSEGGALPSALPGIGWSDHWSFWQQGYPAIMATDTAPFRNPHYHMPTDLPDTLDYPRMARVVTGLREAIVDLAGARD